MIEQNAVAGKHSIGLPIINRCPVCVQFGAGIRRPGIKWGEFRLGRFLHLAIEFRSGSLVETGFFFQTEYADSLQHAQCANCIHFGCVFRRLERYTHVALCSQIVNLIGLNFLGDADETGGIRQIAIVQDKPPACLMRVFIEVINSLGVKK